MALSTRSSAKAPTEVPTNDIPRSPQLSPAPASFSPKSRPSMIPTRLLFPEAASIAFPFFTSHATIHLCFHKEQGQEGSSNWHVKIPYLEELLLFPRILFLATHQLRTVAGLGP